jgi:hypothetical protein
MGHALPRGAIAYERSVAVARLHVGDVITYDRPAGGRVTHRIAWAGRDGRGRRAFATKGDANGARDPWRVVLPRATQRLVVAHVPLAGYALAALGSRPLRIAAIGLPALALGLAALRRRRPA